MLPAILESPHSPYGRRLLSAVVEERAQQGWHKPIASVPRGTTARDGYRDVSYRAFVNAVHRTAHWIEKNVGTSSTHETVAYIGPGDLRYQLLMHAAPKTGHVMMFVSPRNSEAAFASLFEEAKVQTLISASSKLLPTLDAASKKSGLQNLVIPTLEEFLDEVEVERFECLFQTFEELRMQPWLRLHTSGSTGLPKVVTLKHGFTTALDAFKDLEEDELEIRYGNTRLLVLSPLFHVAGVLASASAVWYDCTLILPPAAPLNADLVGDVIKQASVEFTMFPPSILTDMAKSNIHLNTLSLLKGASFAGGPLSEVTADLVGKRTRLFSSIGATEWAAVPMRPKDNSDCNYFHFNMTWGGIEFRPADSTGLFELVIVRNNAMKYLQAVFTTFPDNDEYPTKDLFAPHPTKEGFWTYVSRRDDIIVFSNGEKLNPVTMEGLIGTCPALSGCVVVGQGRFQAALLAEPKDLSKSHEQLLKEVWPFVEKANQSCPKHGRIVKELVMFTSPQKPLPRAGKGTVQRAPANGAFKDEIDALYQTVEERSRSKSLKQETLDLTTETTTRASLRKYLMRTMEVPSLSDSQDFFTLGLDSLQLLGIVRIINASHPAHPIDARHVYDNASIERLAHIIHSRKPPKDYSDFDSDDEDDKEAWYSMDRMFESYSKSLPLDPSRKPDHFRKAFKSTNHAPISQPDGGLEAWLQVLGSFLININNWGLVNSFGVFQAYYQANYLSHMSASDIAWIGTVQGALLLTVGVLSGPLFDKGYFQVLLVAAGIGLVFAMMMVSISTQFYQLMLAQGVLAGICSGLLYIPSIAVIPLYFKKHRGLALGLATAGGSVGGVIYPIAFRSLLNSVGFGWATRTIAFLVLITIGMATLVIKPIGPRTSRQLIDPSAFKDLPTLAFMAQAFFLFAGVFVPFFLCTSFAIEQTHSSEDLGFYLVAVINAAQLLGRILPGVASDYWGGDWMLYAGIVSTSVVGFSWIAVSSVGGFAAWLIFFGFASGIVATLPAAVLPFLCPSLGVIGTRLGMVYAAAGVGVLISTPVGAALDARTGGFLGAQVWVGAVSAAAAVFAAYTTYHAWMRRRLYETRKRGVSPV